MGNKKIVLFVLCLAIAGAAIYFVSRSRGGAREAGLVFQAEINNEGGVSVEATPLNFEIGQKINFQISFNTHRGDLNFDITKISELYDDAGKQYRPLEWQGGAGGHHLTGILVFPSISSKSKTMKLIIKNVYGVPERSFEWSLN